MNAADTAQVAHHAIIGDLSIHSVQREESRLLGLLRAGGHVEVDLGGMASIDAAGIQLLLLVQREAGARGCRVVFTGESPVASGVIDFCRQAARLGDLPASRRRP